MVHTLQRQETPPKPRQPDTCHNLPKYNNPTRNRSLGPEGSDFEKPSYQADHLRRYAPQRDQPSTQASQNRAEVTDHLDKAKTKN